MSLVLTAQHSLHFHMCWTRLTLLPQSYMKMRAANMQRTRERGCTWQNSWRGQNVSLWARCEQSDSAVVTVVTVVRLAPQNSPAKDSEMLRRMRSEESSWRWRNQWTQESLAQAERSWHLLIDGVHLNCWNSQKLTAFLMKLSMKLAKTPLVTGAGNKSISFPSPSCPNRMDTTPVRTSEQKKSELFHLFTCWIRRRDEMVIMWETVHCL